MRARVVFSLVLAATALTIPARAQSTPPPGEGVAIRSGPVDYGAWGALPQIGGVPVRYDELTSGRRDPPPVPAQLTGRRRADAELARAEKLLSIGRGAQMLQALDAAIAADPGHAGAHHLRARLLLFEGRAEQALAPASAAIAASRDRPSADHYATRAAAYLALGALPQAIEDGRAALKIDAAHPIGPRVMLEDAIARGAHADVAALARRALAAAPNDHALQLRVADATLAAGEAAAAEDMFTRAITREPHLFSPYYGRARARLARGHVKQALDDLDAILGDKGGAPLIPHAGPLAAEILLKRAALHAQLGAPLRGRDDVKAAVFGGGVRVVLQVQIFLREAGHETPLSGVADTAFQTALTKCLSTENCARKLFELRQPTIDGKTLRRA